MGDSYATGRGAGAEYRVHREVEGKPKNNEDYCTLSPKSYGSLFAARDAGVPFKFLACGGETTDRFNT